MDPPPPTSLGVDKDPNSSGSDARPSDTEDAASEAGHLKSNRTAKQPWHRDKHWQESGAAARHSEDGNLSTRPPTNQFEATSANSSKPPPRKEGVRMADSRPVDTSESQYSEYWSKEERNAFHLARKRRNAAKSRENKRQRMSDLKAKEEHFERLVQRLVSEQTVLKAQIDVLKTTFQDLAARSLPSNSSSASCQAIGSARSEPQTTASPRAIRGDCTAPLNVMPRGWNTSHGPVHPPYAGYNILPLALKFPIIQGSNSTSGLTGIPTTRDNSSDGGIPPKQGNTAQGISVLASAVGGTNIPATAPEAQGVQDLMRLATMAGFRSS